MGIKEEGGGIFLPKPIHGYTLAMWYTFDVYHEFEKENSKSTKKRLGYFHTFEHPSETSSRDP